MDAIREQLNRPVTSAVVGFVVGIIVGLVALGWWLFPVQWTDAAPQHLRSDLQQDYLRMAVDSFSLNKDAELARNRFQNLGESADQVLADVVASPGAQGLELSQFASAVGAEISAGVDAPSTVGAAASPLRTALLVMCGVTAVLAVALAVVFVVRRQAGEGVPSLGTQQAISETQPSDIALKGEEPPLAQFMTTYMLGDDLFDDSFSVDSASGEFLGECGVGIAETIGVGDPKRVSSFELWLFDKNDIQTVTKVIMSSHSFHDEAIRQRLAAKGEPVLAETGQQIILETATLQLVARVVDMSYGEGALPEDSFFDRITLDLTVWPTA